jgi:hypothetical protein
MPERSRSEVYSRGRLLGLLLALAAVVLAPLPLAAQTLATYDTFEDESIDPRRWTVLEHTIRYGSPPGGWSNAIERERERHPEFSVVNTLVDRRIVSGQLRLHLRTRGGIHDNTMAPGHGRLAVRPTSHSLSDAVTRLQARVTVVAAEAQPCRAIGASRTRAQLYAELFGDNGSQRMVFATLSLQRSSFGADQIVAVLSRCTAADCAVAEDIDWVVFSRSWVPGSAHTLTISHRPADARVQFSVGGGGAAESRTLRYSPPPESVRGTAVGLRVENSPSNCPAGGGAPSERVRVTMDARFDNVRLNVSAVPTEPP